MRTACSVVRWCCVLLLVGVIGGFAAPRFLWADGSVLENPPNGGKVGGIIVISGWKCPATGPLTFTINNDSAHPAPLSYGSLRGDTPCNNPNNGFAALWNSGLVAQDQPRTITISVFDNGVQFAQATVTVAASLGSPFVKGLSATTQVDNFPGPGQDTTLQWQESAQNFVISSVEGSGGAGICDTQTGTVTNFLTGNQTIFTVTNPCAGSEVDIQLATPQGNAGASSVCNTQLTFLQGDVQVASGSFVWKDANGATVCGGVLPGVTNQTTVALNAGVSLDFKKSFSVFYDQVKIADFH